MPLDGDASLRVRLHTALTAARKARDDVATTALRSTLGAIDNAEAVPAAVGDRESNPLGDGSVGQMGMGEMGVGVADAPRRLLTDDDVESIVRAEIAERCAEAVEYDECGQADRAARLRAEADVLASHLPG